MSETIEAIVDEHFTFHTEKFGSDWRAFTKDEFRSALTRAAEGRWEAWQARSALKPEGEFEQIKRDAVTTEMFRTLWANGLMLQWMNGAAKRSAGDSFDALVEAMRSMVAECVPLPEGAVKLLWVATTTGDRCFKMWDGRQVIFDYEGKPKAAPKSDVFFTDEVLVTRKEPI